MNNTSKIILFILLIFNTFASFAQTLEFKRIDFFVNYSGNQEEEDGLLQVKALLKVDNMKNDTIVLRTNVKIMRYPILAPRKIKAYLINKDKRLPLLAWVDMQSGQSENTQLIKIVVPNKRKATIQVSYYVLGSVMIKYSPGCDHFGAWQQRQEYYYPMNIPIRKIKVSTTDSLQHFLSYKKEKKQIRDINIAAIVKSGYNTKNVTKGNLNINLHIPDSLTGDKRMLQNITDLQQYMDKLSVFLSSSKNVDIIYTNWRDDKARAAFGEALGNHAICDIHFQSRDLLHELLHMLLPVEVGQYSKGEYFMKESINEWLTLFFSNKTCNIYISDSTNSVSLYNAQINNHTTWDLIYRTGPSIIQQISSKCGEEKMAHIIISFLNKNKNKETNYDKFLTYVKKHLSNDLGNEMDSLIKTSY